MDERGAVPKLACGISREMHVLDYIATIFVVIVAVVVLVVMLVLVVRVLVVGAAGFETCLSTELILRHLGRMGLGILIMALMETRRW